MYEVFFLFCTIAYISLKYLSLLSSPMAFSKLKTLMLQIFETDIPETTFVNYLPTNIKQNAKIFVIIAKIDVNYWKWRLILNQQYWLIKIIKNVFTLLWADGKTLPVFTRL